MDTSKIFKELYQDYPLPAFIDELAARAPANPYISIPVNNHDASQGWKDVTISGFSHAVNKASWWLIEVLGGKGVSFPAIHFFLSQDLSALIFTLASVKAGYKGIICHPETPVETHLSINTKIGCNIMIFSGELSSKAKALYAENHGMRLLAAPPVEYWLEGATAAPFPYPKTLKEAWNDPFAIVHSSGTTGIPKPICFTQGTFSMMVSSLICCHDVDKLNYATLRGRRVATMVPLTIAAGLFHNMGANFSFNYTPVLQSCTTPLSIQTLAAMMSHADISALIANPKLLPELLEHPDLLQEFKGKIRSVIFPGAPLTQHVGDELSKLTMISPAYGSTETGVYPIYSTIPEDWQYYHYDPIFSGSLKPVNSLGYHEVVIPRTGGFDTPFQSVFDLFPDLQEWRTKDVFIQHTDPAKKDLWRYAGRIDDFVNYREDRSQVNGHKLDNQEMPAFLPIDMENIIAKDREVRSAIICDNRSGRLAVVVEPSTLNDGRDWTDHMKQEFIEQIWPSIEEANKICPVPASISKQLVIVTGQPFLRGAKGYPQRQLVIKTYGEMIDKAYG